jgi:hypothetical protein
MKIRGSPLALTLILCLSPARILTSAFAPVMLLFYLKRIKRQEFYSAVIFIAISLISFLLSKNLLFLNYLISIIFLSPFLLLAFFGKSITSQINAKQLNSAAELFFNVLLINGAIGIVQYVIYQNDDAAIGFYGRSGLQNHGLAILYTFATVYFYCQKRNTLNIVKIALAIISFISCSYGVGMVAVIISATISFIVMSRSKLKSGLIVLSLIAALTGGLYTINKVAFMYNVNTLLIFSQSFISIIDGTESQGSLIARKLVAWLNYFHMISEHTTLFFTGVGGGGFNSRASFMLNGDYTSVSFVPISVSEWHSKYIMPLWSQSILSQAYQDGSMNQPFSSFLSILAEYGIFGVTLVIGSFIKLRSFLLSQLATNQRRETNALNFCFIFMLMAGLLDNIYEYTEIILPYFMLIYWLALKNRNLVQTPSYKIKSL